MGSVYFIPRPDSEFDEWIQNFVVLLKQFGAALGIPGNLITDMDNLMQTWVADYQGHLVAKAAARGKREAKDETLDNAAKLARTITNMLQANPATTNEQRELFRITVPDTKPTPLSPDYVLSVPPPLISLDFSKRQQITIHFGPNPENERENAKPEGIAGAKIWFHVVSPLPQEAKAKDMGKFLESLSYQEWHEWFFLADDTNSPYVHVVETNVPVTIEYKAQWFDTRMRLGVFGDPVKVTVTP